MSDERYDGYKPKEDTAPADGTPSSEPVPEKEGVPCYTAPADQTNLYDTYQQITEEKSVLQDNGYDGYTSQEPVYGYTEPAPSQTVYSYTPTTYTGYASTSPAPSRKGISAPAVAIIAVICSIIASMMTSIFFYGAGMLTEDGSDGSDTVADGGIPENNVTTIVNNSESTVEAVAEKASPSIVGIRVTSSQSHFFYGTQESTSEGSGVIYTDDGYIITNYHVIESIVTNPSASSLEVYLNDGSAKSYDAEVIGYEIGSDLAVIKMNAKNLKAADIGNSDELKLGQTVICLGNPGGISYIGSVSQGIISGLNRTVSIDNIGDMTLIQTDAAVNPGNSGGAMLDADGMLIGIVSSKIVSEEYEGIGFAIPVNTAVDVVEKIINNKGSKMPYTGLTISTTYTSDVLNKMGYPSGVVVEQSSGPAATAGIQRGDVITEFNGTKVTSYEEYDALLQKCKPGETIKVTVFRNRRYYTATVTLGQTYN